MKKGWFALCARGATVCQQPSEALDATEDVTSWNHSCGLKQGPLRETAPMVHIESEAGREARGAVGTDAWVLQPASACSPSPTPGGLLSTQQHLLIEGLHAESRGANLEAE